MRWFALLTLCAGLAACGEESAWTLECGETETQTTLLPTFMNGQVILVPQFSEVCYRWLRTEKP